MKKLITLTLTFIMALTLVLSLVPSVYAEGPVETVDVALYLWSENDESLFTYDDVIYGQSFAVDASLFAEDGRFVAWVVDGVKSDEAAETSFIATSNMKLELIFAPTDTYAAVFVDSNGHVIDVVYVDAETAVVAPENLPNKPGFELATPAWDKTLGLIDADTFYQIRYQLDTDHEFTITVDGEPQDYLYNSVVTISSELEGFTAWLEDGQVVSYDINYTFTALSDRILVASNDESYTEAPLVTLLDVSPLRDGYSSFVGQVQLPEGYELVEAGLLFSDSDEAPTYDTAATVLKSAAFHPVTNEFLRSILDANMTDYVRAYAVVKDAEDNLETIYSFVEEESGEDPFEGFTAVSTPAEFYAMVSSSGSFYLTQDIDFTAYTWTPKGGTFTGIFDGNGFAVQNLTFSRTGTRAGIFYDTNNAEIRNVTLDNVNITTDRGTGLLVSQSAGTTTLKDITIINSTAVGDDNVGTGILLGRTVNASHTVTISNIFVNNSTADATAAKNAALIGRVYSPTTVNISDVLITNSFFKSTNNSNDNGVGTLLGYIDSVTAFFNASNIVIINPEFTVNSTRSIGALIGATDGGSVTLDSIFLDVDISSVTHVRSGVVGEGTDVQLAVINVSSVFGNIIGEKPVITGSNRSLPMLAENKVNVGEIDTEWWELTLPSIYNNPFFADLFEE